MSAEDWDDVGGQYADLDFQDDYDEEIEDLSDFHLRNVRDKSETKDKNEQRTNQANKRRNY